MKLCQTAGCTNKAIWSIKTANESGSFLVCRKHKLSVEDYFKKLGHEPTATYLGPAPHQ